MSILPRYQRVGPVILSTFIQLVSVSSIALTRAVSTGIETMLGLCHFAILAHLILLEQFTEHSLVLILTLRC